MRYYSNVARPTTIENPGGLNTTSTVLILGSTSGLPSNKPFTLRLSPGTTNEELVTVIQGSGTSADPYLIVRSEDGTTGKSHPQFSAVSHGFSARDLREPQDHIADKYHHVQPLLVSTQAAEPPYTPLNTFVNFLSASWPAITFVAPPSGTIVVTVGAALFNTASTSAVAWVNYRISGGITLEGNDRHGVSCAGTRVYASRTRHITGLTPGVNTTVTPTWNISAGNSGNASITGGQLTVQLLPLA